MSAYLPNTPEQVQIMLQTLGLESTAPLFDPIPETLRDPPIRLDPPLSEWELAQEMTALAARNAGTSYLCFLGGGAYDHFIPAVVEAIASRGEFFTAYTPYQPELSQGELQVFFEFQTLISELTGLPVANASLYDGATALWEAVLMALRITGRGKVLLDSALNPRYRAALRTYLQALETPWEELPLHQGLLDFEAAEARLSEEVAALAVALPNSFGILADYTPLFQKARQQGILSIVVANPLALALVKPPGEMGADVCVGEGQPLGLPLNFGGPYLGFFAARQEFLRQLPGRLIGMTTDAEGRRAFVMTLQTREQHIRRARATSNICTNQALCALRATVFLTALGKQGLARLAYLNLQKSAYLKRCLAALPGVGFPFPHPTFNEFVFTTPIPSHHLVRRMQQKGILAGLPLWPDYPEPHALLVACTEKRSRAEIEGYAEALAAILQEERGR